MDAAGVLDERWDEVDDFVRARNLPSPQLIGTLERRTIDLNTLAALGVRPRASSKPNDNSAESAAIVSRAPGFGRRAPPSHRSRRRHGHTAMPD